MLIAIFYNGLGIFPPERYSMTTFYYIYLSGKWHTYTGLITIDGLLNGKPLIALDLIYHMVLPTVTLTVMPFSVLFNGPFRGSCNAEVELELDTRLVPPISNIEPWAMPKFGKPAAI